MCKIEKIVFGRIGARCLFEEIDHTLHIFCQLYYIIFSVKAIAQQYGLLMGFPINALVTQMAKIWIQSNDRELHRQRSKNFPHKSFVFRIKIIFPTFKTL
jgi:hypothetical protein